MAVAAKRNIKRVTRRITGTTGLEAEVARLQTHIAALEAHVARQDRELEMCRRLNVQLAELMDVVGELLVPAMDRDEEKVASLLRRYAPDSWGGPGAALEAQSSS